MRYEKNLKEVAIFTKEEYPTQEILCCHTIIKDKVFLMENGIVEFNFKTWLKLKKRLGVLERILATNQPNPNKGMFTRTIPYGYLKPNKLGRLYPKVQSVLNLSRDVRFFLFKDRYRDYDLRNAHPTILYEFTLEKGVETPLLKQLVLNRAEFNEEVSNELNYKTNVKKQIIIAFNMDPSEYRTKSKKLKAFNKELQHIQSVVLDHFKNTDPQVEFKRGVTAQSYYCMTRESEIVTGLYKFMNEKLGTDPSLLHFIPVFDGALIRHESYAESLKIDEIIEQFNTTLNISCFVEKKIQEEQESFVTKREFDIHMAIRHKINELKAADIPYLAQEVGMDPFALPDFLVDELIQSEAGRAADIEELRNIRKKEKEKEKKAEIDKQINDIVPLSLVERSLSRKVKNECHIYQGLFRELLYDSEVAGTLDESIKKATSKKKEPET